MTAMEQEAPSASALIASEVRAEMGRRGISKTTMGARLGVSHAWVNRRVGMTADVEITFEEAERMAAVLGIPVLQLLDPYLRACRDSNPKPSDLVPAPVLRLVRPSPVTILRRTQPVASEPRSSRHLSAVAS